MVSFQFIHSSRPLSTMHVRGIHYLVITAEFAFWSWIQKCHVFEGTASDQDSRGTVHGASFRFDGGNLEIKGLVSRILLHELSACPLIPLGERQYRREIGPGWVLWAIIVIWLFVDYLGYWTKMLTSFV